MRKKYLSALLFGALLFASAGTFTSCKDYDDDINNLQEQINTIASSLNDLKTKVESMGGVKDVTFADGVLTVTTDAGSATYTIPDKVGITKVELKDGVLYVDDVEAGKAQTVEVKDGILYIDGEAQELNVNFDSNVVAVIDKAAGIYTLTVNNETIELPIAYATVSVKPVDDDTYFTENTLGISNTAAGVGIHWARATKDVTWDGPKGNITKDMLVVGQIKGAGVSVRPVTFDLTTAELGLISSTGVVAPVTVKAWAGQDNGPINSSSRVGVNNLQHGDYALTVELNKDLTDRQVVESFATADGNANVMYALTVNGVKATDYVYVIDTQLKADAQLAAPEVEDYKLCFGGVSGTYYDLPVGTHKISYADGRVYDVKVEIDPSSESDAKVYGLSVDTQAGTITIGEKAQERNFKLKVTLIDVNGNISKTEVVGVRFAERTSQTVELEASQYTVTPAQVKDIVIDLGDTFTSLTDEEAITIQGVWNIDWTTEDNKFLIDKNLLKTLGHANPVLDLTGGIVYYEDEACTKPISEDDFKKGEAVKKIRYAKIPVNPANMYSTAYNSNATTGEHLLKLTLRRNTGVGAGDTNVTIKTVNVPVHVTMPTWDEVFKTTTQWSSNTYITRIANENLNDVKISMDAFGDVNNEWLGEHNNIKITKLVYTDKEGREQQAGALNYPYVVSTPVQLKYTALTNGTVESGKLAFTTMNAVAEYVVGGVSDFTIQKEFTVQLKSIFEDAAFTATSAKIGNDNIIKDLKIGLNGYDVKVNANDFTNLGFTNPDGTVGQFVLVPSPIATGRTNEISYQLVAECSSLTNPQATLNANGVLISGTAGTIEAGKGGTFTIVFTDVMGVQTTAKINFTK
ncbi:hypothetical protein QUW55_10970 [Phocaeicola barnesiae]|uniref:hypothetical protein n=1 Tax=Phocaeicola barnesiae TaxID=376804 RepID=UPI0025A382BD|nr:hypothetical protein [Phocaeicola barnesiae]MDM8252123.1 hypothetical protein [Phocaeicola barnesiae]